MKIKNLQLKLFFLLLGVCLFGLTKKLPDWRWMGQKNDPYFSMFETGLPIFRPWLPIEALEWRWFESHWVSSNLMYGLLGGWILYLLFQNSRPRSTSEGVSGVVGVITAAIAIWYAGNGGALYDITGIFALAYLLFQLRSINEHTKTNELVGMGFLLAILDLSRPFAIFICLIILAFIALKLRAKVIVPFYILILLVAPFHINQMVRYDTFELSTYGGNNLVEALGGKVHAGEDCYQYEAAQQLDTLAAAQCAAVNKRYIIGRYLENPSLLRHSINFERLRKVLFPALVWHANGLDAESRLQKAIQMIFNGMLLVVYIFAIMAFLQKPNRTYKILLIVIAAYIIFINLIASRLSETIRIILPATVTLIMLSQAYVRAKNNNDPSQD
jgi:hypothetical protein